MATRRLLTISASLALALTGIAAPSAGTWAASSAQARSVIASTESTPSSVVTTGHTVQASSSVPAPTRRRFRSRRTSHDPVSVLISLIIFALLAGGYFLYRYISSRNGGRQSRMMNYNGPSGPQYGVTAGNYGGTQYPQNGAPMNTPMQAGGGYPAGDYGYHYGNQQGGSPSSGANGPYGPYGTGY